MKIKMRHIYLFENFRDDIKDKVVSNIQIPDEYREHIDDIKNELNVFLDSLSDSEMETVSKIQKIRSGEMDPSELDSIDSKTLNKIQIKVLDIIGTYTLK